MSIQIFCSACKTSSGLDADFCSKCKKPFGRSRQYRVQVSVKGKRATRVTDNLTLAREVESALKADLVRGEFDISHHKATKVPTLNEVWGKYLPWAKENKKSWKDDEWYYRKHLEPRFGSKTLGSIAPFDIEKMKTELKKGLNAQGRPYAAQTIKHQIVILRRLFNLARKWGLYDGENPVSKVQMPHVDNRVTEYMSDEELSRLTKVLSNWPYDDSAAFVKFALFTGLRRSALFRLQWTDIDFDRGTVTPVPKGKKKRQTIPVSDEALSVLKGLKATSPYVFPGKDGKQRTDFKGPWQRIRRAAGLPPKFRFHGLRHHFGSTLVSNGYDLAVVRELLTHEEISTTMRYAHLRPDVVKAAALKSGALLTPKRDQQKVVKLER